MSTIKNCSSTTHIDLAHVLAFPIKVSFVICLLLGCSLEQLRRIRKPISGIIVASINSVFERLGKAAKIRPVGTAESVNPSLVRADLHILAANLQRPDGTVGNLATHSKNSI